MRACVVTEGQADALFLEWLLGKRFNGTDFSVVAAAGKSSAQAHARTLLYAQQLPVALVIDADTNDPARIAEDRRYFVDSLEKVAGETPFCVALCVPAIEALLFTDVSLLERAAGRRLTQRERIEAEFAPKRVLEQVFADQEQPLIEFVKRSKSADPTSLRRQGVAAQLAEFLESISVKAA